MWFGQIKVDSSPVRYCVTNDKLCFASVPAQIEVPGDTHVILEGGDITLVCGTSAIGNPTPTISWTDNNGTTVSDGSGISGSDTLMLTIMDVTRNHTGNWTCSVENSVRDAERRIVLVVVGEYVYKVVSHLRVVTVSLLSACSCSYSISIICHIILSSKSQGGTV